MQVSLIFVFSYLLTFKYITMKKLVILASVLLLALTATAQPDVKKVREIDYYGIDYSLAKVYGATETPEQFKGLFNAVNELVIHEYKKFNIGHYFNKQAVEPLLEATVKKNDAIPTDQIFTRDRNYVLSQKQLADHIKEYDITPKYGVGMVIIAELLNKASNHGSYYVVFFDTLGKEILFSKHASGKPGGFGLRNYWAGSVFDIMRNWKY